MSVILTSSAGTCCNILHQYSRANHTIKTYCYPNRSFVFYVYDLQTRNLYSVLDGSFLHAGGFVLIYVFACF